MYRLFFLILVAAFTANAQPPNCYYHYSSLKVSTSMTFDSINKTFIYRSSKVSRGFMSNSAMQGSFEIKGDSIVLTCKPKAVTPCKKIDISSEHDEGFGSKAEVKGNVNLIFGCNVSTSPNECGLGKLLEVKTLPTKWYKVVISDCNKKQLFTRTIKANQAPFSTEVPRKKIPLYAKITDDKGAIIIEGEYVDKYACKKIIFNGWQYYPCECGDSPNFKWDKVQHTTNCHLVYHYKKSGQNIVLNGAVFQSSQTPLKNKKN
jgi:hypothetical protein